MIPAFCKEYYQKTGHKVVAVMAGNGGEPIAHFLPNSDSRNDDKVQYIYEAMCEVYNSAIKYMNNSGLTIGNKLWVSCQGESDLLYILSDSKHKEEYITMYNDVVSNLRRDTGLGKGALVETSYYFGGYYTDSSGNVKRYDLDMDIVNMMKDDQEKIAKDDDDIVIGTSYAYDRYIPHENQYSKVTSKIYSGKTYSQALTQANKSICAPTYNYVHFTSAALCQMGKESADSLTNAFLNDIVKVKTIAIESVPSKTEYVIKEGNLNLSGGKIKVTYDNGKNEILNMNDSNVSVTGFNNSKLGSNVLKVEVGGKSVTFNVTIVAKNITITAINQTVTYGTTITKTVAKVTATTLISGDGLNAITLTQNTTNVTTSGKITPSAAKIVDGNGTDVTENYSITYVEGKLTINAKSITIPSSPADKTYNGASQACGITTPTGASVVAASSTTSATDIGTYSVVYQLSSTTNYKWSDGTTTNKTVTWKIKQLGLTVTATDQTVTYGTTITKKVAKAKVETLVSGHSLNAITLNQSTTNATQNGTITPSAAKIVDGNLNDVTANYKITYVNGKLIINAKSVTIPSSPTDKIYNGTTQSCEITTPTEASIVTASSTTSATATGTYSMVYQLSSTTNYKWSDGTTTNKTVTWKIKAKDITITAADQTVTSGTEIIKTVAKVKTETLVSGHSLNAITLTQSTTNVTTSGKITPSAAKIVDRDRNDVTSNYNITYINGNLTITEKIILNVDFKDQKEKEQDGIKYIISSNENIKIGDYKNTISTNGTIKIYKDKYELGENEVIGTGMIIKVELDNQSMEYIAIVSGDVTGDGVINVNDIFQINKCRLKRGTLDVAQIIAGDVNIDNIVNAMDIFQINRYRLKKMK